MALPAELNAYAQQVFRGALDEIGAAHRDDPVWTYFGVPGTRGRLLLEDQTDHSTACAISGEFEIELGPEIGIVRYPTVFLGETPEAALDAGVPFAARGWVPPLCAALCPHDSSPPEMTGATVLASGEEYGWHAFAGPVQFWGQADAARALVDAAESRVLLSYVMADCALGERVFDGFKLTVGFSADGERIAECWGQTGEISDASEKLASAFPWPEYRAIAVVRQFWMVRRAEIPTTLRGDLDRMNSGSSRKWWRFWRR